MTTSMTRLTLILSAATVLSAQPAAKQASQRSFADRSVEAACRRWSMRPRRMTRRR